MTMNSGLAIGYLGPKILGDNQVKILSGIKKAAQQHKITLFHFGGPFPDDTKEVIAQSSFVYNLLNPDIIDGIISWSSQLCNDDGYFFNIEAFLEQNPSFPAVFIGKAVKDYPTVVIDNDNGIHKMMDHLINVHGYRKFAFIAGPEFHPYAVERYQTFVKILESNAITVRPELISPHYAFKDELGVEAIRHFIDIKKLKPKEDFEVIVSVSDMFSFTAISELQRRKIRVPQDIAVTGFNNKYDSISSKPTITTIDVNYEGMGESSVELLIELLNGTKKTGTFYSSTQLIIRQSCGCLNRAQNTFENQNQTIIIKGSSSKDSIIHQLNEQKDDLLLRINNRLDMGISIKAQWSETLLNGVIESFDDNSTDSFLSKLQDIFDRIEKNEFDLNIWNQYFIVCKETLLSISSDVDFNNWVLLLYDLAKSLLIQEAERCMAYVKMKMIHFQGRTVNLFQSIVSTYKLPVLLELLLNELPQFGIEACYFMLFKNAPESTEQALLKMAYDQKDKYRLYDNEISFTASHLLPHEFTKSVDNLYHLILPLYFRNTPMGFLILAISVLSEFNGIIYEVLRSLISSSLQAAKDVHNLQITQTQLEKKAKEAIEANRAKTQFLRNMSHEIRTPLNCIIGFAEVIISELDKNQINQHVSAIELESHKLLELINQLLDLSKIEADKLEIRNTRFSIVETIRSIDTTFYQNAKLKGLQYTTNISRDIPTFVIGDALRLRQIIINLVGNSIKFTNEGEISLSASIHNETDSELLFYFEIKDTGIGISEKDMKTLFDPFVQVENSNTRKFGGSGLGTAISKQFVSMMGGEIGVESQLNKGSTFWFTVKCLKCSQEAEPLSNKEILQLSETQELLLKQSVILIADDYPPNRKVASFHLRQLGCKIDHAENGRMAVDMFTRGKYDLILMDIQMPELDGLSATKRIRNLPGGKKIPIIAMTAIAYREDITNFKENDMNDVITKPFKKQDFTKTVIYWLLSTKKQA